MLNITKFIKIFYERRKRLNKFKKIYKRVVEAEKRISYLESIINKKETAQEVPVQEQLKESF